MISLFFSILSQPTNADIENKIYTDQDLKKFNQSSPTVKKENSTFKQIPSFQYQSPDGKTHTYEWKDPVLPRNNAVNLNQQINDAYEKERQQRIDDEKMRADKIQQKRLQQIQINREKAIEAAKTTAGAFIFFFFIMPAIAWITALISVLRNEFTGNNKLIWFLTVTFIPIVGPILYFFMQEKYKIYPQETE
jgi:hypothetical protein